MSKEVEILWEATLGQLQLQVSRPSFDTWLKDTAGISLEGDSLTVGTPTPFAAEWLEHRMLDLIQRTVTRIASSPLRVRFEVTPSQKSGPSNILPPAAMGQDPAQYIGRPSLGKQISFPPVPARGGMNLNYTFEAFVVGSSNQLAYAAACAVAEKPGGQYNPLFIYSGVGLGKTHLLQAIASAAIARNLQPLYVTAEQFTNDFIRSIRDRKSDEFRERYRGPDLLLVDDIQFIRGKEQTQEGLFHTFNDLHNRNKQIVIACDQPPQTLSLLEERLRSRFEWGLLADMAPPGLETRIAILQKKAAAMDMHLPIDAAHTIASHSTGSVRELEGKLNKLCAMARFLNLPATQDLAADIFPPSQTDEGSFRMSPKDVASNIASYFQISPEALFLRNRDRKTTYAQRVAMYYLCEKALVSPWETGQILGQWHRKTVLNAVRSISSTISKDGRTKEDINAITNLISNAPRPQEVLPSR